MSAPYAAPNAQPGGKLKTIPIIALTANAISGMEDTCLANRMDRSISKPINITRLNQMLLRWLPGEKIVPAAGS